MTLQLNVPAEYEYAVPDRIEDRLPDPEPQVPKKWMILILKGCSTEFTSDQTYRNWIVDRLNSKGRPYVEFEYHDGTEHYRQVGGHCWVSK